MAGTQDDAINISDSDDDDIVMVSEVTPPPRKRKKVNKPAQDVVKVSDEVEVVSGMLIHSPLFLPHL